jgi:hypothetical protein
VGVLGSCGRLPPKHFPAVLVGRMPRRAFDLHPTAPGAGEIRRVPALRHHALNINVDEDVAKLLPALDEGQRLRAGRASVTRQIALTG